MKRESITEAYLRRATRGLWGRRRREVREELEAHLYERVMAHRIAGLSEVDATEKALVELGRPQEVSVGMARLYTLPTVMGSGLAVLALCLSVLVFWPKGLAQPAVLGSFYWPSQACTAALRTDSILGAYEACRQFDNSLWLDPQAFVKTLEAQGVKIRHNDNVLTLTFPGGEYVGISTGAPTLILNDWMTLDDESVKAEEAQEVPAVPGALSLWNVLKAVGEQSELPIRVEGDKNPTVRLGNISGRN